MLADGVARRGAMGQPFRDGTRCVIGAELVATRRVNGQPASNSRGVHLGTWAGERYAKGVYRLKSESIRTSRAGPMSKSAFDGSVRGALYVDNSS